MAIKYGKGLRGFLGRVPTIDYQYTPMPFREMLGLAQLQTQRNVAQQRMDLAREQMDLTREMQEQRLDMQQQGLDLRRDALDFRKDSFEDTFGLQEDQLNLNKQLKNIKLIGEVNELFSNPILPVDAEYFSGMENTFKEGLGEVMQNNGLSSNAVTSYLAKGFTDFTGSEYLNAQKAYAGYQADLKNITANVKDPALQRIYAAELLENYQGVGAGDTYSSGMGFSSLTDMEASKYFDDLAKSVAADTRTEIVKRGTSGQQVVNIEEKLYEDVFNILYERAEGAGDIRQFYQDKYGDNADIILQRVIDSAARAASFTEEKGRDVKDIGSLFGAQPVSSTPLTLRGTDATVGDPDFSYQSIVTGLDNLSKDRSSGAYIQNITFTNEAHRLAGVSPADKLTEEQQESVVEKYNELANMNLNLKNLPVASMKDNQKNAIAGLAQRIATDDLLTITSVKDMSASKPKFEEVDIDDQEKYSKRNLNITEISSRPFYDARLQGPAFKIEGYMGGDGEYSKTGSVVKEKQNAIFYEGIVPADQVMELGIVPVNGTMIEMADLTRPNTATTSSITRAYTERLREVDPQVKENHEYTLKMINNGSFVFELINTDTGRAVPGAPVKQFSSLYDATEYIESLIQQ